MWLKKNIVSYVIWALMLILTGVLLSFWGLEAAKRYANGNLFAAIGFVAVFAAILFLLYYLTGILLKRIKPHERHFFVGIKVPITETLLVVTFLITAISIRGYCLSEVSRDYTYFNLAQVAGDGSIPVQFVQGSVYYYCALLHGVFRIFGNRWDVGIWLQIILQTLSSLLLYMGVRKLSGKLCAMLVLLFLCFSKVGLDAGLSYSPQMLFLCLFGLVFWICADYLSRSGQEETRPLGMWIYTVLVGVLVGITCYVDVSGFVLLFLLICVEWVERGPGKSAFWFLRYVVIVATALLAFVLAIFVDGILSGTSFLRVLNAWYIIYGSVGINFKAIIMERQIEFLWLTAIISVGWFSFWRRKTQERFSPYALMLIGISLLYFTEITVETMDGKYLLFMLMSALGAVSVMELFYRAPEKALAEGSEMVAGDEYFEKNKEKVEIIDLEKHDLQENNQNKIENPLPVPKKRERKAMDYAFEPKGTQMVFDIRVADNDDFDI